MSIKTDVRRPEKLQETRKRGTPTQDTPKRRQARDWRKEMGELYFQTYPIGYVSDWD